MNTLDLDNLQKITSQAQKLQAIGALVKAKLLTPYYVTNQKKFWLSQVMKLPRKQPWNLRSD